MLHGETNQESQQGIKTLILDLDDVPRRPQILNHNKNNKPMLFGNSQISSSSGQSAALLIEVSNNEKGQSQSNDINNGVIVNVDDNNNNHDLERLVSASTDEQLSQMVTIRDAHSMNSIFNLTQEDIQEQITHDEKHQIFSSSKSTGMSHGSISNSTRMLALIENRIEDKQQLKKQDNNNHNHNTKIIHQMNQCQNVNGKENSNNISQQSENSNHNSNTKQNNWKRIIANKNQSNCNNSNTNANNTTTINTKPLIQIETQSQPLSQDKQLNCPQENIQYSQSPLDSTINLKNILAKSRDENKHILDIMKRQESAMRELASELHSNDQAAASAAQQTIITLEHTVQQQKTQIINQQRELTSLTLELKGKDDTIIRYSNEIKQLQIELRQLYGKKPLIVLEKSIQTDIEQNNDLRKKQQILCYSQSVQTIDLIRSQLNCSTQTNNYQSTQIDSSSQTLESKLNQKSIKIMVGSDEPITVDQTNGMIQEYLLKISDLEMVLSQVQFELSQVKRQNQEFNQVQSQRGNSYGNCSNTGKEICEKEIKQAMKNQSSSNCDNNLSQECQTKQENVNELLGSEHHDRDDQYHKIEEPLISQTQRSLSQSSYEQSQQQQLSYSQSSQSKSKRKQSLGDSQQHLYSSQHLCSIDGLYRSVQAGKESASYMSLKEKKQRQQQQQQQQQLSSERGRSTDRNITTNVVRAFGSDDISEGSHMQLISSMQSSYHLLPPVAHQRHNNLHSSSSLNINKQGKQQIQEKQLSSQQQSSSQISLQYSQSSHQLRQPNSNTNNNNKIISKSNTEDTNRISQQRSSSNNIMPMFLNSSSS